jgi:hypothetical protein
MRSGRRKFTHPAPVGKAASGLYRAVGTGTIGPRGARHAVSCAAHEFEIFQWNLSTGRVAFPKHQKRLSACD